MPKILDFSGGINTRVDPTLLNLNQAQSLVNVDTNPIILQSLKANLADGSSDAYMYNFNGSWVSSNNARDYVEYESKLYYTDAVDGPKMYDGTTEKNMGLAAPVPTLAEDNTGQPILDEQGEQFLGLAATVNSFTDSDLNYTLAGFNRTDGDLPNATYNYRVTIVADSTDNVYEVDDNITTAGAQNSVSITIPANNGMTARVYREYSGTYRLLAEITLDTQRVIVDNTEDISAKDAYTAISVPTGTVTYTMTFYNGDDGIESAPMANSNEVTINRGDIVQLRNLPVPTDAQITKKRIYRNGGNLTEMTLVAELDINDLEYNDYTADIDATTQLGSQKHIPPSSSMHSLVESYGIMFGLVDNTLVFSEIDKPYAWPLENSFNFKATCTGLLVANQGLLVFTTNETYLVRGTSLADFTRILISEDQGCIASRSCQKTKNVPLWVSNDGICVFESGYVKVISKPALGKINLSVIQSDIYDEQYFLLKDDGTLLVMDLRYGLSFYELDYGSGVNAIDGLRTYGGDLYYSIDGSRVKAFSDSADLSLTYESPDFIEGNTAELKYWNKVYLRSDGSFTVKLYVDGTLKETHTVSGNDNHELTFPQGSDSVGYSAKVEIVGTGKVYALEVVPSQGARNVAT